MIIKISKTKARQGMALLWFFFFAINVLAVAYLYVSGWIEADNFWACLSQLNAAYATYVGVVLLFYFGSRSQVKQDRRRAGAPFVIALLGSLLWNGVILLFIVRLLLLQGSVEDSIEQIERISATFSWLVAPCIGYYFGVSSA